MCGRSTPLNLTFFKGQLYLIIDHGLIIICCKTSNMVDLSFYWVVLICILEVIVPSSYVRSILMDVAALC